MNYIGSKIRLLPFLEKSIETSISGKLSNAIFCDLFAGTGAVGKHFKPLCSSVIANDLEFYSFVLNRNYIGNTQPLQLDKQIDILDNLRGVEGFIYKNYCRSGHGERNYFTDQNGKRIDAIRLQIETWKQSEELSENGYYFLLASLLESADKVANTASVYGAFLKHIKKTAQQTLTFKPAVFEVNNGVHQVFQGDANEVIKQIEGDILYLDPPYNARQYGSNYHLLNTIAAYQEFEPKGVTGLPSYNRSAYCSKASVRHSFDDLIAQAKFRYVFLSYNNEGLLSHQEISDILSSYGKVTVKTQSYQRFKADKTENRNHSATSTLEYLFCLEKT